MAARVSFIVPVYNIEACLQRCVRSVLGQTFRDLECICVDDGSTDGSGTILDVLAKEDSRLKVVHQPNRGVSVARNVGLDLAIGEYVVFVDSDDVVQEDFLPAALASMNANDKLDVWIGQRIVVDMELKPYAQQPAAIPTQVITDPIQRFLRMEGRYYLYCVWGKVFRRSVIRQNDLRFKEGVSLGEDSLFAAEFYAVCRQVQIDDHCFGYLHSQRPGSLVRRDWVDMIPDYLTSIREILAFGEAKGIARCIHPLAAQWALGRMSVMFHRGYANFWMRRYIIALCSHPEFKTMILGTIARFGARRYACVAKLMSLLPRRLLVEILFGAVCLNNVRRPTKFI